ncbi:MAG: sensor histidine kinase [Thermoanaerobaculia bacterium]
MSDAHSLSVVPLPPQEFAAVGALLTSRDCVAPETRVERVSERFFKSTGLDSLALVADGVPVGLLTRQQFFFSIFRRFGYELFAREPVSLIADQRPLIVGADEKLDAVLERALRRDAEHVYDDLVVVDETGSYIGLLSVKQLVLEQSFSLANILMQSELATSRAREAEEMGRIKSQFLANVTHELRSPVNAIIELGELIRLAAQNGYIDQINDRLALLLSSATNLRSIITNILNLSKLEAGRMEVLAEDFDLTAVLREVVDTTQVLIAAKPIDVTLTGCDGRYEVHSDPVKVRQIVLNLTSNAAKFTERGLIVVHVEPGAAVFRIAVRDTGIGIEGEDLARLFEAFAQVADAQTKHVDGTGLGLTITKQLAEMLGGAVHVRSEFGKGSTFEVVLPRIYRKEARND